MIRVVLAVALTTPLLGVSLPVIDDARKGHTETAVRTELQRVERAATDLLETNDPTDEGARRVLELRFTTRRWSDAGVESVTIGESHAGSGGRLTMSCSRWVCSARVAGCLAGGLSHSRHRSSTVHIRTSRRVAGTGRSWEFSRGRSPGGSHRPSSRPGPRPSPHSASELAAPSSFSTDRHEKFENRSGRSKTA